MYIYSTVALSNYYKNVSNGYRGFTTVKGLKNKSEIKMKFKYKHIQTNKSYCQYYNEDKDGRTKNKERTGLPLLTCFNASFKSFCALFCFKSRRSFADCRFCWFLGGRPRFLFTGACDPVVLLALTDPTSSIIFFAWNKEFTLEHLTPTLKKKERKEKKNLKIINKRHNYDKIKWNFIFLYINFTLISLTWKKKKWH